MNNLNFASKFWEPVRLEINGDSMNRYRIEGNNIQAALLGEGSYGKVYRAYDRVRKHAVAIKEIAKQRLGSEERRLV